MKKTYILLATLLLTGCVTNMTRTTGSEKITYIPILEANDANRTTVYPMAFSEKHRIVFLEKDSENVQHILQTYNINGDKICSSVATMSYNMGSQPIPLSSYQDDLAGKAGKAEIRGSNVLVMEGIKSSINKEGIKNYVADYKVYSCNFDF